MPVSVFTPDSLSLLANSSLTLLLTSGGDFLAVGVVARGLASAFAGICRVSRDRCRDTEAPSDRCRDTCLATVGAGLVPGLGSFGREASDLGRR